jgi:LuxR family maltose regulon positive regulatory protein
LGHTASIRAYRAVEVPDIARAIEQAERARRLLPREARVTRSIALFTLGNAYRFNNDLARATDAYEQAVALGKEAEVVHILAPSVSALGRLRVQCGQLHRAAQVYRETLDRLSGPGGGLSPIAADVCSRLGDLYYEWNDLETAFSYLRRGVELGRAGMNAGLLVSNTLSLAWALRAHGDVSEADAALQTADDLCRERGIHPRIRNLRIAHHGRLHVMRGDREAAARWMTDNTLGVEDELGYAWQETYVALAQALTLLGRYDQALSLLARLLRMAQQVGCNGHVIKIQACRAMVFGAQDRADDAVAALSPALHLAEPEGYVRTFVDCGPMMADLLKQVALAGTAPAYVGTLLAAFKSEGPSVHTVKAGTDPARAALVEPLTDRELEVLRLIAAGLSNAEIAQELYVALSTVKKHINHLYGKLQVHRRIEAVVKARELGLL